MDGRGQPKVDIDCDPAFLRLREMLGAPDRRGWRRLVRLRGPGREDAPALDRASGQSKGRRAGALAAIALPVLAVMAVLVAWAVADTSSPSEGRVPAVGGLASRPADADADADDHGPDRPTEPVPAANPTPGADPVPQQVWPGEPVEVLAGGEVRVGGARWQVGEAGDVVVVGDWDCDNRPTPGVLRTATGEFSVFDSWAEPGQATEARRVATVATATGAAAQGCGAVVLRTADGNSHRIDLIEAP